jgi:hypothetical protein
VHRAAMPPVYKVPARAPSGGRAVKRDLKPYKPPDGGTVRDEIVTLRLVLKTAILHCWLTHSPDLSPPYKTQGKVVHRPQFSPDEYEKLFESAR